MEILSRADIYEAGRRYLLARATKIEPQQVDVEGSNANIFVGSVSFMANAVMRQTVRAVKNLLLRTAEGEGLDRYVFDRYEETRKGAALARGPVTMSRLTFTAGGGTVAAGTKLLTLGGVEYVTLQDAVFGATALSVSNINVRAVQAGKAFQVGRNQIRKFSNPSQLFDTSITVNNPDPTAGGEDAEDDPTFKERMRDFWRTQRRGTLAAIEFGAKRVAGIYSAAATEALTGAATPARVVVLYLTDSSGVASAQLAADVLAELEEFRCGGIAVIASGSLPQIVKVVLKLSFVAGIDTVTLAQLVRTAMVGYINSLGANATLERGQLLALLTRYAPNGLITKESSIVEPAGDVVPVAGFTIRTTLADVSLA